MYPRGNAENDYCVLSNKLSVIRWFLVYLESFIYLLTFLSSKVVLKFYGTYENWVEFIESAIAL